MIIVSPTFQDDKVLECEDNQEIVEPIMNDDVEAFAKISGINQNTLIKFKNANKLSMLSCSAPLGSICLVFGAEKCFAFLCEKFNMNELNYDYKDRSPILYAAAGGNLNLFKKAYKFMDKWGNNFKQQKPGKTGDENMCHYAAKFNRFHIVQYLSYKLKQEFNTGADATPLMWACSNNAVDVVRFLVDIVEVNVNAKTKRGWTALHYAVKENAVEATKILLSCSKIDLHDLLIAEKENKDVKNPFSTPLHIAISNGCSENVKALIEAGFIVEKDDYLSFIKFLFNHKLRVTEKVYKPLKDDNKKLECIDAFLDNEKALKEYGEDILVTAINEAYNNVAVAYEFSIKSFSHTCEEVDKHSDVISTQKLMELIAAKVESFDEPEKLPLFDHLSQMKSFDPEWTGDTNKNLILYALDPKKENKPSQSGVNPNQEDNNEESTQKEGIVSKLIQVGVSPNQEDGCGKKIIYYAAEVSESMLNIIVNAPTFDAKKCVMDLVINPVTRK